uniref:Uncharacterized protein n=1 Tax=Arundo donax TaxID=35708 RepID=A0A0A9AYE5_ARUDO
MVILLTVKCEGKSYTNADHFFCDV